MQPIPYKYVDGHCVNAFYNDDLVRSALNYTPRLGDVFIATYPKCGTTWVQFVVYGIFHGGCLPKDSLEFALASPYLEFLGAEAALRMPRPGAMKTHMPFHRVPYSKDAKYITVARNPFDVCVSFYYHTKQNTTYDVNEITFDDYFDNFVRGAVPFGDYFDHLLSWYEHRHDTNVLFLTYEGLKTDTRAVILKIADFLGSEYGNMLRANDSIMKKLLEGSEFRNMKAIVDSGESVLHRLLDLPPERALKTLEVFRQSLGSPNKNEVRYLRKGIVGDWRNHFSEEQVERMKKRISEKCAHTEVMNLWDGLRLPF